MRRLGHSASALYMDARRGSSARLPTRQSALFLGQQKQQQEEQVVVTHLNISHVHVENDLAATIRSVFAGPSLFILLNFYLNVNEIAAQTPPHLVQISDSAVVLNAGERLALQCAVVKSGNPLSVT